MRLADPSRQRRADPDRHWQNGEAINAGYRHNYGFTGLADTLLQRGQQLSGALGIPLVRLSDQSSVGLSATGESGIRNYSDSIRSQQETRLRRTEAGPGEANEEKKELATAV